MSKRVLFLLLLAFALAPRPASADPLRITSGLFALDFEGDVFGFTGDGFSLRTTEILIYSEKRFAERCFFCAEGERIDWSFETTDDEQLLGRGNVVLGDLNATNVDFVGSMRFNAVPTPLSSGGALEFNFVAPFSFEALIRGIQGGEELFAQQFIGNGFLSVHYEASTSAGIFVSDDDRELFEFSGGAPVPEPGTIMLLGSGIVATVLRRRRAA